jgi:uncharacterized protein YbaR (Trm112 family)
MADTRSMYPANAEASAQPIEQMLDLLACPACLGSFRIALAGVICTACARTYPVVDGIPILLVDRAPLPA